MSAVDVGKLISVVGLHFPRPRFRDDAEEAAWTASIVRCLSSFSPEVLAKATELIVRDRDPKRDGKYFPVPAELIKACRDAQGVLERASDPPLLSEGRKDQSQYAGWRVDLANDLVKTEMGREAAKSGWIGSLWDFCRRMARLPDRHEIRNVRSDAEAFDEALDACERGEVGFATKPLLDLGRKIKARREEMAREVVR